ncbi:MAG: hypothetical protein JSS70_03930 [Bacteroidetes bacterium]|nr:hypothetical protein [Bacteroidota bacterium]
MSNPTIALPRNRIIIFLCFFTVLLILVPSSYVHAQLCTGSLGDPVVNINFGTGSANTGYTPTNAYTYVSNSCPNDVLLLSPVQRQVALAIPGIQ